MAKKTKAPPVKPPKPVKPPTMTLEELSDVVRHNLAVNLLHSAPEVDEEEDDDDDDQG